MSAVTFEQVKTFYQQVPAKIFWKSKKDFGKDLDDRFKMIYNEKGQEKYYLEFKFAEFLGYVRDDV